MGQACSNVEPSLGTLREQMETSTCQRAVYLPGNQQILLEYSDGSASRLQLTHPNLLPDMPFNFIQQVGRNSYLTDHQRLITMHPLESLNSEHFMNLARQCQHAVAFAKLDAYNSRLAVLPEQIFLCKAKQVNTLIVISQCLSKQQQPMVSLRKLAEFMLSKSIEWQDSELSLIVSKSIQQLISMQQSCARIDFKDVLISAEGLCLMVADYSGVSKAERKTLSCEAQAKQYFCSMMGTSKIYPSCMKLLESAPVPGKTQAECETHLQLYIESYYQHNVLADGIVFTELVRIYSLFAQYEQIEAVIDRSVVAWELNAQYTSTALAALVALLDNYPQPSKPAATLSAVSSSLSSASQHAKISSENYHRYLNTLERFALQFARHEKKEGNYSISLYWLEKCLQLSSSVELKLQLSDLLCILSQYSKAQRLIEEILQVEPLEAKVIEEAIRILLEANLETAVAMLQKHEAVLRDQYKYEYFAGKIMLMKAVELRESCQKHGEPASQNTIKSNEMDDFSQSEKYFLQGCTLLEAAHHRNIDDPLYLISVLESLGDLELYRKSLVSAEQYYSQAKLVYLTLPVSHSIRKEKYAGILASLANIEFLRKNYKESLEYYGLALKLASDENPAFKHYVMGNMGLVQVYSGDLREGASTLSFILTKVSEKDKTSNADYKFFSEELDKAKRKMKENK